MAGSIRSEGPLLRGFLDVMSFEYVYGSNRKVLKSETIRGITRGILFMVHELNLEISDKKKVLRLKIRDLGVYQSRDGR